VNGKRSREREREREGGNRAGKYRMLLREITVSFSMFKVLPNHRHPWRKLKPVIAL